MRYQCRQADQRTSNPRKPYQRRQADQRTSNPRKPRPKSRTSSPARGPGLGPYAPLVSGPGRGSAPRRRPGPHRPVAVGLALVIALATGVGLFVAGPRRRSIRGAGVEAGVTTSVEQTTTTAIDELSPQEAFAQAADRLVSGGSFGYVGTTSAIDVSHVRPGLWLAVDLTVEGEVVTSAESVHEIAVDGSGRAAETVSEGPVVWGRLATSREALPDATYLPITEESGGQAAGKGVALLPTWLDSTVDRQDAGTDGRGNRLLRATLPANVLGEIVDGRAGGGRQRAVDARRRRRSGTGRGHVGTDRAPAAARSRPRPHRGACRHRPAGRRTLTARRSSERSESGWPDPQAGAGSAGVIPTAWRMTDAHPPGSMPRVAKRSEASSSSADAPGSPTTSSAMAQPEPDDRLRDAIVRRVDLRTELGEPGVDIGRADCPGRLPPRLPAPPTTDRDTSIGRRPPPSERRRARRPPRPAAARARAVTAPG